MLNKLAVWVPLFGPLFAAVVAVFGWYTAHLLNAARDRANRRHDMITQYLLEAYRRLEMAANREDKTEEQAIAFESAIADIQLLGTATQISKTVQYLKVHASGDLGLIDEVLSQLRSDLREELGLSRIDGRPVVFRFTRDLAGGDWRGNPIQRTTPAHAAKGAE